MYLRPFCLMEKVYVDISYHKVVGYTDHIFVLDMHIILTVTEISKRVHYILGFFWKYI